MTWHVRRTGGKAASVICLLTVSLTGCVSYRTGSTPDVELGRQDFAAAAKPTACVVIDVQSQSFNESRPGKNVEAAQKARSVVAGVFSAVEPFKAYTFNESRAKEMTVRLVFHLQVKEECSLANMLLSCGTFAVIPVTGTTTYHLTAQLFDGGGVKLGEYEAADSMRIWMQILLFPIGTWKAPAKTEKELLENLVRIVLARIRSDGLLYH